MTRALAYAPGRVELLGNHTDYNEGVVLGAAIDRGLSVRAERRDDNIISFVSESMGRAEIPLANLKPNDETRWLNYPLGVVSELLSLGIPIGGFSATVSGNLPAGFGLSSSAAFAVATAYCLLKLFERELPLLAIAKLCQRAEQRFVGVRSGLLDQVVSIFGRAEHAIFFDARTEEVRTVPFPPEFALIIAESGRKRELVEGLYNLRRQETGRAAQLLGVRALRDTSSADLSSRALPSLLRRRAAHIVGENERVWRAIDYLASGDGAGFGRLMNDSHESSRHNFENSSPELDLLVAIAQELHGVLGARLTGGGFGGAIVILCERPRAAETAEHLARNYSRRSSFVAQTFVCQFADGAH